MLCIVNLINQPHLWFHFINLFIMKKILHTIAIFSLIILASCGGSEDPAPHTVGSWELESFVLVNLPSAYSQNENRTFAVNEVNFGGTTFSSYELTIENNGSYIRKIGILGGVSSNDQGTWEVSTDGTDLTINSDDTNIGSQDWGVTKNELDQLWITLPSSFGLMSNETRDGLIAEHGADGVNEYLNSLTSEEFNALFDTVSVDLLHAFKRVV